jgi:alanine-glyoxylate transaminase/serine-glyoxylate transaminase/serine-pyruvate transaminase
MARSGRHFLQIPGPTNVPDRVLRALSKPTIDHRGPEFATLAKEALSGLKEVFMTSSPVIVYPGSGTGAWEASLVNTLSPGDTVLMFETGHFATLWKDVATRIGLNVDFVAGDWRHGADPAVVFDKLANDRTHTIKAVCVVHNETSTGVVSRIADIRKEIDAARHPALLLVDTISSLGSIEYRHEAWGVDVTVGCSQKGLMLPPGISFNAISDKALAAAKSAKMPRAYWDWEPMLRDNKAGFFPYTPSTNILYGLREALIMMRDEGLEAIWSRHERFGRATRAAVKAWGMDIVGDEPGRVQWRAHRGRHAGWSRRGRIPTGGARTVRHVAGHRTRQVEGKNLPHRASRRLQRPDARRHAERRRDGPGAGRRSAQVRRRARGAGTADGGVAGAGLLGTRD